MDFIRAHRSDFSSAQSRPNPPKLDEFQVSGTPAVTRVDNQVDFDWDIDPIPVSSNQGGFSARWTGQIRPQITGDYVFKVRGDGGLRLIVNNQTLIDNFSSPTLPPVGYGPTVSYSAKIALQANQVYTVEIDYRRVGGFFDTFEQGGLTGIQASWASLQPPPNFNHYDAVVVCAGINNEYEGEGEDRPFTLPEFQDELIKNIAAVNPRTIVKLNQRSLLILMRALTDGMRWPGSTLSLSDLPRKTAT